MLGTVWDLLVKLSLSSALPTRRSYFSKLPEQIKANMLTITVSITLSISIDDTHSQPLSARQQKPSRRASLADFFGSLTNLIKGKLGLKEEHCRLQHPQGNEVCLMVWGGLHWELWLRRQSRSQRDERIGFFLHVRCYGRINWAAVKSISKTNYNSKFLCSEKYASLKTARVIFSLMKNCKRSPSCLTCILERFSLTARSECSLNTFCWWCQNNSSRAGSRCAQPWSALVKHLWGSKHSNVSRER